MMQRIHIVGCSPRSGTTLMMELMVNGFQIDQACDHEIGLYKWPPDYSHVYLTKAPRDLPIAAPLLTSCKFLHVVFMLRDPRDVIVSQHSARQGMYWTGLTPWKRLTALAESLPELPNFMTVKYEDLVTDPDSVQRTIADRWPWLKQSNPFSAYTRTASPGSRALRALGGLREVDTSSIGKWRNHLPRIVGQMELHGDMTPALIRYNYEHDDSWKQELSGVDADLSESVWPEDAVMLRSESRQQPTLRMKAGFIASHSALLRPLMKILGRGGQE